MHTSSSRASRRRKFYIRRNWPIVCTFTFSTTCASSSQTHTLRTFDPRDSTCVRCVPPAGSAAHNNVLDCIFATTRSAAHNGVLNQQDICKWKLSAIPASTRSGKQGSGDPVAPARRGGTTGGWVGSVATKAATSRGSILIFQLPRCSAYCSCTTQSPVLSF